MVNRPSVRSYMLSLEKKNERAADFSSAKTSVNSRGNAMNVDMTSF
jgi:hypothetical protein